VSRHAHGYVPQTLADTGLLGLAASLALLAAWLAATLRTTGLIPRLRRFGENGRRRDWDSDRLAMVALVLVPVVFGLQSVIDWTWFVPGPAVMGLVAAGFVAGRGPAAPALAGGPTAETVVAEPKPPSSEGRRPRPEPIRILAALGALVCAVLFAWTAWQPEASDRASNRALELSDKGDQRAAAAEADSAATANPLTPEPLLVKGVVQTKAGNLPAAETALERAVFDFPGDPQTWLRLATFQLDTNDDPAGALDTVEGTLYLDPRSKPARQLFLEARARLRAKQLRPNRGT
jgi:tetratricopeptide (TPR) repeat protein